MAGPERRRAIARHVGAGIAALCLGLVVWALWRNLGHLPPVDWGPRALASLAAGVLLAVAVIAVHSVGWLVMLRAAAPRVSYAETFAITGTSQVAKYLPGNVFQYVSRVALARRHGVPAGDAALSLAVETLLLLATALAVAAPGLVAYGAPRLGGVELGGSAVAVALLLAGLAGGVVVGVALRRGRALLARLRPFLAAHRIGVVVAATAVNFALYGLSVDLVAHGLWPGAPLGWADYTWGCALAWALGFVTPGSPGGIGVREAVLMALYRDALGTGAAAGLFLVMRLVSTAGDLVSFAVARLVARRFAGTTDRSRGES